MLNRFQGWRERGWVPVEAEVYAQAWQRFGGSVATHPLIVERLADLAQIPVRYLGWEQDGELKGAIATWGRDLALSKDVLKRRGKKGVFDLGNAEIILPIAADAQLPVRHRGRYLSALNEGRVSTLKPQAEQLAMARTPEDLSKKFRYNQRRELRLLEEAGGVVRGVSFPAASWRRSTATCSSAAGASRPPAPSIWRRCWACSRSSWWARYCFSTMRRLPCNWCIASRRPSGSASNTSTAVSTLRPVSSAPAAC